jgi:hypothetical protein
MRYCNPDSSLRESQRPKPNSLYGTRGGVRLAVVRYATRFACWISKLKPMTGSARISRGCTFLTIARIRRNRIWRARYKNLRAQIFWSRFCAATQNAEKAGFSSWPGARSIAYIFADERPLDSARGIQNIRSKRQLPQPENMDVVKWIKTALEHH